MFTLKNIGLAVAVLAAVLFTGYCWGVVNEGGVCPVTRLLNGDFNIFTCPCCSDDCCGGTECGDGAYCPDACKGKCSKPICDDPVPPRLAESCKCCTDCTCVGDCLCDSSGRCCKECKCGRTVTTGPDGKIRLPKEQTEPGVRGLK